MKTKRFLAMVLCVMSLFGLVACGEKTPSYLEGERSLTHKITDEPLELTYFGKDMVEYRDQSIWFGAFDKTNILIKPTLSENVTDMDQALALAVAAKDIPDVVYDWRRENFNKYGLQGALIPLNDLIDQYAPNYKKFLDEHPDVRYFSTASDGNIYFIPMIQDGVATTGWFIRQDWLDKLNLKAPNNVQELYDVMVAFRDGDPNGNGQKDEVPYFGMQADVASLMSLFDAYDVFRYTEDGKVSYGPMEDNYLKAVKEIRKWYQEGLIDKEYFTRSDAQTHFPSNNNGGIIHHWFASTALNNSRLKSTNPEFNLVPFAPPAGSDGVRREFGRRLPVNGEGWAISVQNEHPVETIKFFDFWFSEEGRKLVNFGLEGIHHDIVDGKPQLKKELVETGQITVTLNSIRSMTNFGFQADFEQEKQWSHPYAIEGAQMYIDGGYLPNPVTRPLLSYLEDEKRHNTLKTQIETAVKETTQKWIIGVSDPETEFESFKKTLRSLGVEEYVAIEQKAYDKYFESVVGK